MRTVKLGYNDFTDMNKFISTLLVPYDTLMFTVIMKQYWKSLKASHSLVWLKCYVLPHSSNGFTVNSSTSRVVKANAISSLKCDPVRVVNSPDNSSKKLASPRVVKPHDHGGIPKNLPKKSRPTPMVKSKSDIPFSGASEKARLKNCLLSSFIR